jgi:hypothetical protein
MSEPARVLLVAHQTASTEGLREAVRERARRGPTRFHLLVPQQPAGLHKVVDPQDAGREQARQVLQEALPALSEAAGEEVTGGVGDDDPLAAIEAAISLERYDEIIISTLPSRLSRWLKLDLVSKVRGLGLPVTHVEAAEEQEAHTSA